MMNAKRKNSPLRAQCRWIAGLLASIVLLLSPIGYSKAEAKVEKDEILYLKSLSLEDLANLEVTSVSKKSEKLLNAAAAVFVITGEDIRRSGVTTIPGALRMVPGIQVARIDANKWAVTARGFNGSFASKLLVMIDGRTVYSPLWSGVFWNVQDTMLEDNDRIEVVRGPGASLWGANAVNGIINIITKTAKDTQGGLISGGIGTEERGFANVRYGWQPSNDSYARLYAKYYDRDEAVESDGDDGNDQWSALRGGFRFDWEPGEANMFTVQGDFYSGSADGTYEFATLDPPTYVDTVFDESKLSGGNLLTRWTRTISSESDMALQIYFDQTQAEDDLYSEVRHTFDIDFQHRMQVNSINELVWGMGYRTTDSDTEDLRNTAFDPEDRTLDLYSLFVQDQITVVPDRFWLTFGSKFENHTFTDWEFQPTGRFLWKPEENHSIWGAVSRALRTPSRAERDVVFHLRTLPPASPPLNPGPFPVQVQVSGSEDFESEEVTAIELGYRYVASDRLRWDLALFYNEYENVNSSETMPQIFVPGPPPYVIAPETINNGQKVDSRGLELSLNMFPADWWKIDAAYSYLTLHQNSGNSEFSETSPCNQLSLRSTMDLFDDFELDLWVRYVDELPALDIDEYMTLDFRFSWSPRPNLELSLIGQNLLDDQHLEFVDLFLPIRSTEVERSIYAKVTWTF